MKFSTLLTTAALAVSLIAPRAIAQESPKMDSAAKKKVIETMSNLITKYAYVPGVDFNKITSLLDKEKDKIDKAQTEDDFSNAVNEALQQFGFSHIVLMAVFRNQPEPGSYSICGRL